MLAIARWAIPFQRAPALMTWLLLVTAALVCAEAHAGPASAAEVAATLEPLSSEVRDAIAKQSARKQEATKQELQDEVDHLQSQLESLLARTPRTAQLKTQIEDVSDALSVKTGALDIASGSADKASRAAQEAWANTHEPFFLMCRDQLWTPKMDSSEWKQELEKIHPSLVRLGRSVGLIQLDDGPVGTGFVVATRYVLTNRHVARMIADPDKTWALRGNVTVVFDREYPLGSKDSCPSGFPEHSYLVTGIAWSATPPQDDACTEAADDLIDGCNDVAVLLTAADGAYPAPVPIVARDAGAYEGNMVFAVIGYPGPASDMSHSEQQDNFHPPGILTAQFGYKRLSAGDASAKPLLADIAFWHLVNTNGGNSGSPIIDIKNGDVVGLHFAGRPKNGSVLGRNLGIVGKTVIADLQEAGVLPRVAPASLESSVNCLQGTWPEVSGNGQSSQFTWSFTKRPGSEGKDDLQIRRSDGFVSGEFHYDSESGRWLGYLRWGNNELWPGVVLSPSTDCKLVRTNQSWMYRQQ